MKRGEGAKPNLPFAMQSKSIFALIKKKKKNASDSMAA